MHDEAHLDEQDIRVICEWTEGERTRLVNEE
jgi:hypothetical protein